ncbi:MAG: 3-octaprenyl-4-hydroxybenzoate carboxy-lyase [Alphaproteobacteria bacterium TMED87]|nr:3-octaprenyl-4-hydroxybenzoate carboxy-lyase [Rhodospirillaceae bacterium]OUV08623.1 MAG: 3-octaprenyl-4-hydroxybenzoate carboxy-lyase [Alphaproteobacteria bacterium TMED87]|tara:strand:- start:2 stop:568 length:567 start_codon:yes stop_codon:yes gene_type:complete
MESKSRIIIGISGASGIIYGIRLLEELSKTDLETHLVISKSAELTLSHENQLKSSELKKLADVYHPVADIGASISSGSYKTLGMIVAPCSIRTASEISSGVTSNLLTRSADVTLKERRKLVLMVRESPLHTGHLRTLTNLSEIGAIIAPPVPAFYSKPKNIDDIINHNIGRILDLFDIKNELVDRWNG